MRSDIDIKNLANAVQYWLSYWDTVSRSNILQEGSLRYSISEVIERKYNGMCVLELPHPCFKNRNIDITWSDDIKDDAIFEEFTKRGFERKANNQLTDAIDKLYQNSDVIECKVVSKHTEYKSEIQRIFNDLCRLYFYKLRYPKRRAFFLLSGGSELFNSIKNGELINGNGNNQSNEDSPSVLMKSYLTNEEYIRNQPSKCHSIDNTELYNARKRPQKEGEVLNVYTDWFSFNIRQPLRLLDLVKPDKSNTSNSGDDITNSTHYSRFLQDYQFRSNQSETSSQYKHIVFNTCLIVLNEASAGIATEHSVAIWEIRPS